MIITAKSIFLIQPYMCQLPNFISTAIASADEKKLYLV